MTFKHLTYRLLLAFAPLAVLAGCADDLLAIQDKEQAAVDTEPGVWVSVKISTPRETRAAINGDWGVGSEDARMNENKIHDLNIFFLRDGWENNLPPEEYGLNTDYSKKLFSHKYIPSGLFDEKGTSNVTGVEIDSIDNYYTCKYKITGDDKPEKNDFIIVVANWGDSIKNITTLKEIQDLTIPKSWRDYGNADVNDWFVMSNAYNNQYASGFVNRVQIDESKYLGTYGAPYGGLVYLRRAAARIDILYGEGNLPEEDDPDTEKTETEIFPTDNTGYLKYKVNDSDAYVELTDILPVNLKQTGSYLFKRTTTKLDLSTVNHAGSEILENKLPGNYVIEPNTLSKRTGYSWPLSDWYDTTHADTLSKSSFTAPGSIKDILKISFDSNESSPIASVITYAEENTQTEDVEDQRKFATGLLLRAVYHPKYVYSGVHTDGNPTGAGDPYSHTGTFWRYMPNLVPASSPERRDARFVRPQQPGGSEQESEDDSEDARTVRPYAPTKATAGDLDDSKALYFYTKEAAEDYAKAHPEDAASITKFDQGVCYYNVWIRHAIDGEPGCPMEFGIVRNNLYRLSFTFSGPGTPDVEIREPYGIETRIFVRPWNVREHPEIIL